MSEQDEGQVKTEEKQKSLRPTGCGMVIVLALAAVISFFVTCGVTAEMTHTGRGIPGDNAIGLGVVTGSVAAFLAVAIIMSQFTK